mgnify:CR=1 FL=1|tara:strand:- start:245409 stop:248852 length:3444 start_codon:yes stop_codon:yes gene_type:complete
MSLFNVRRNRQRNIRTQRGRHQVERRSDSRRDVAYTCLRLQQLEDRRLLAVIGNNLSSGSELRNYRVAIAATAEYTAFHGSQAAAYAEIQNFVSDLNAIFEPELAIHFDLVSGTNTVFTDAGSDGYSNGNISAMINENTARLDAVVGSSNYDVGHVFGTLIGAGGSGLAGLGVVGGGGKGRGASISSNPIGSSFTSLAAHEFGHQFGAEHTFNSTVGSCSGNRESTNAYEPASGSTLMGYAGICGADNLQADGSNLFHSASFEEIATLISSAPALPNSVTTLSNAVPTVSGGADFTIPAGTPFELIASGSDADASDDLTYSWEQLDLGPSQSLPLSGNVAGPLFRTYDPVDSTNRVFPNLPDLLANVDTAVIGEVLPTTARDMNFRVTVRDGNGGINSDDVLVSVVNTPAAFEVLSPNTATTWSGGSSQTVTWNEAGTSGGAIGTTDVDITLSTDGGMTYPFTLATTANNGSYTFDVPNIDTTEARIRVQGSGNIFFDVSDENFSITSNPALPGLTFAETDGDTRPVEGGADDSYTVSLNTEPSGTVSIQFDADPQTLISVDGSAFASSVTADFSSMSPKTVLVRAVDDAVIEGPHLSTIMHSVTASTSATYSVGMALNNVVASVYDNEDPPLIGVDLNLNGDTTAPSNWTSFTMPATFSPQTISNLTRDDGLATPFDVTFQFQPGVSNLGSSSGSISTGTLPQHTPVLNDVAGANQANGPLKITWSDLTPGADYGVYLFGLDGFGGGDGQDVTITGDGIPFGFTQALSGTQLFVNDATGTSTQSIIDSEIAVTADPSGEIEILVTPNSTSGFYSIAGTAIRGIPEPVILSPEIDVLGNAMSINDGDSTPDIADDTQFGSVDAGTGSVTKTYTIDNTAGTGPLNVSAISIVGSSDFSTPTFSPTVVAAGSSITFDVTYAPSDVGTDDAVVQITNDDADESLYDFAIEGTGQAIVLPPSVDSVLINGNTDVQRSAITSIVITFDSLVDVPDNAFSITNLGIPFQTSSTPVTGLIVDTVDGATQTVTTITFGTGDSVVDRTIGANTLDDGNYRLDIVGALVTAEGGGPAMASDYDFGADLADDFFRLYGDTSGDGATNFTDFANGFLPAFATSTGDASYRDELDATGDGNVNFTDFSNGFLPNFATGRN